VQGYGIHIVPGWLVEGIADYVRFFRWSHGQLGPINPDKSHYYGSYRITASFLNYLVEHYDSDIVRKLNQICREGKYRDGVFQNLTGKSGAAGLGLAVAGTVAAKAYRRSRKARIAPHYGARLFLALGAKAPHRSAECVSDVA
jgi:hypothetical protein